jgi:hypothetical protein
VGLDRDSNLSSVVGFFSLSLSYFYLLLLFAVFFLFSFDV